MNETETPRILIARLSAIGDVIHGLPVLCALRDALPQAHLGWIVEKNAAPLLASHPALNRLHVVPKGWLKSPRTVLALRRELRAEHYHTTLDLQGLTKSALAAWLSGAARRIGFGGADGRELSTWINNTLQIPAREHIIDRNLELLAGLTVKIPVPNAPRFDLTLPETDSAKAEAVLRDSGLEERGFAVLNPGAGWASKRWPRERFAAVARYLYETHTLPSLVVWAGAEERTWAEEIVANGGAGAHHAPLTTLTELAALLQRARIFVGSDTGPLHIAVAAGCPCVGLYGPMPAERNGPYGTEHIAIQKQRIEGTSRTRRNASPETMEAIRVEDVTAACAQLLK